MGLSEVILAAITKYYRLDDTQKLVTVLEAAK
jgi:hypothetical protein